MNLHECAKEGIEGITIEVYGCVVVIPIDMMIELYTREGGNASGYDQ